MEARQRLDGAERRRVDTGTTTAYNVGLDNVASDYYHKLYGNTATRSGPCLQYRQVEMAHKVSCYGRHAAATRQFGHLLYEGVNPRISF